ncbi:MAG TPA: ABC transporter substrate-binding protein [Candidatus Nitrosocosmicus sp.]|nr:ABC transporter substrate-binding protein [Candidatus Nitrosocosmicus sp.]
MHTSSKGQIPVTPYSKILSFLPSATEIIFELGLESMLKGVTHECNYPEQALQIPKIIRPTISFKDLDSSEIDKKVREMSIKNQPLFKIDVDKIRQIKPDLIISQNMCSVCAPFNNEIQTTFEILGYKPHNLVLNPTNLLEIFQSILVLGKELDRDEQALKITNQLKERINTIKSILQDPNKKHLFDNQPKVMCLDWLDPFYLAGHWVPDMLDIVGANGLNGHGGLDSHIISPLKIAQLDPDKVVIMPCGFDITRSQKEYHKIQDSNWDSLRANKKNEIYIVNSNAFFSKPSPRIVTGIEILSKIVFPKAFEHIRIPNSSLVRI